MATIGQRSKGLAKMSARDPAKMSARLIGGGALGAGVGTAPARDEANRSAKLSGAEQTNPSVFLQQGVGF